MKKSKVRKNDVYSPPNEVSSRFLHVPRKKGKRTKMVQNKTTYEDCQVSDHTCVCLGVGELKKKDERRKSEMSKHPNLLCGQFLNSPTNPQRGEKEVIEQDIRIFI